MGDKVLVVSGNASYVSLASNFGEVVTNVKEFTYKDMDKGSSYVIYFKGKGYKNLQILSHDYPLN